MDEHLYNHFEAHDMGDMLFVHRYIYKYWPPWIVITTFRCEDEGEYEIWLNFFSRILKVKTSRKTLALLSLVKEITRSLVFATMTFALKLVVEWRQLPRFLAKMLVHAGVLPCIEKISYSS